jgi:hypothetical protein
MIRQIHEVRQWFIGRGRPESGPAPRRRALAPLVEALEGRALLATLAAPSNLAGAALAPDRVSLTWTESSSYVSYFQIEWSNDNGTTYTAPVRSYTKSSVATGLAPSTYYLFRVCAVRSGTSSSWTVSGPIRTPAIAAVSTDPSGNTVYATGFDGTPTDPDPLSLNSPWTYTTNEWVYNNTDGVLRQIQNGDPPAPTTVDRKAMLTGLTAIPNPNDIYAHVRIDTSLLTDGHGDMEGEYARAGVGLYTDPATGRGYNLVFTGRWYNIDPLHPVHLEFLNDGVAWSGWLINGSQTTVAYTVDTAPKLGQWWWFHMTVSGGKLYGNAWRDATNDTSHSPAGEPPGWMIVYDPASQQAQSQWNRAGGVAALTGCDTGTFQSEPPSGGTVAFDDVTVRTGVTVTTTAMTTASASTPALALAPLVFPEARSLDDAILTALASEVLRPRRRR